MKWLTHSNQHIAHLTLSCRLHLNLKSVFTKHFLPSYQIFKLLAPSGDSIRVMINSTSLNFLKQLPNSSASPHWGPASSPPSTLHIPLTVFTKHCSDHYRSQHGVSTHPRIIPDRIPQPAASSLTHGRTRSYHCPCSCLVCAPFSPSGST